MAEEFQAAKVEAAKAKADRDKARRKVAGDLIRGLKQEMAELGEPKIAHSWPNQA